MLVDKTLNGNILCSVGMNTNGDEIFELCVIPLDKNLDPMFDKMFDKGIRIREPDLIKTKRLITFRDESAVYESFDLWSEDITKDGQILPLGYDWPSAKEFLKVFFGNGYKYFFHDTVRDIKTTSHYLNDLAESNDQKPLPFPKQTLKYLGNCCDVEVPGDASALSKAIAIAEIYKKMVMLDASRTIISF